jgi:UDP-N-acetylmuramyl pentapeptide phosphotransferase/UDP-N-acetylglucosamine-1-phosphate transferase
MRTPVYGGALIVAAMVAATVVAMTGTPPWLRTAVWVVALVAALVGVVMTLRDYS